MARLEVVLDGHVFPFLMTWGDSSRNGALSLSLSPFVNSTTRVESVERWMHTREKGGRINTTRAVREQQRGDITLNKS